MRRGMRFPLAIVTVLLALSLAVVAGHSEEEMAQWQKAMTPGAPHEALAQQAGSWVYVATIWEEPGGEPTRFQGIARKTMVMGGRYLQEELSGLFMGQEFQGFGVSGYDNVTGEHVSIWFDNMSTSILHSISKETRSGALECRREQSSFTGEKLKTRSLSRVVDKDHHTYESYQTKPGQSEFLHMRVEFTRVGA